jgi:Spy/CpxP family protein refolding chaperone
MALNRKYTALVVAAILVTGGLVTSWVYAQGRPGFHRGGAQGRMGFPFMLRALNLTDDQKAQVKQVMANHRDTLHQLYTQMRTAHDDMSNQLVSSAALQESDLSPQVQQISSLRSQIAAEILKMTLEIRGVLTPDQLARAAQFRQQMQSMRSQMRSLWQQQRPQAQ